MYADTHTHITGTPFGERVLKPEEIQKVLKTDREHGIVIVVAGGTDLATGERVVEIADAEDIVYASIGIHPWIAEPLNEEASSAFLTLAKRPKVVAFGEIGLDDSRSRASAEVQMQCLRQQLELAREAGIPPIIHQRGLHGELMEILRQGKAPAGAIHGFNGDRAELKEWLDLGYYIVIGRHVLTPEGQDFEAVVREIPEDRLLLETDGVNYSPVGKLEGQERVLQVAQKVASWRGTESEEIGEITTKNLKRMLGI